MTQRISLTGLRSSLFLISCALLPSLGMALAPTPLPSYYPESVALLHGDAKEALRETLTKAHVVRPGARDLLVESCRGYDKKSCFSQTEISGNISYLQARKYLFGQLHLEKNSSGYVVKDVYCRRLITEADGAGVNKIPDANNMNCEHTWPQSRFSTEFSEAVQKVDLHHLFPVDNRANSSRGNHPLMNLDESRPAHESCQSGLYGTARDPESGADVTGFTPPPEHRGNAARALFYFSVRYHLALSELEETSLRQWNREDPVDAAEKARNEAIYQIQKNRNPFIDNPNYADEIQDF